MKSLQAELLEARGGPKAEMAQRERQMLMYEAPSMVDSIRDRELLLDFDLGYFPFAHRSNSFLLAASEFEMASADYPIVFVGDKVRGFSPAVVTSLVSNVNAMLNDSYQWRKHTYIPAFVRRYPFVLIAQESGQLCLGIDRAFPGFGTAKGVRLFDIDGQPSALLRHASAYLSDFHQHMLETQRFCALLNEWDLLVERFFEISAGPQAPPKTIRGFYAIDDKRLRDLSDERSLALIRNGQLKWIHAHLNSLLRVSKLT
jgi:SapC